MVDGAHGPGQLDLELSVAWAATSDVGNGHKWLVRAAGGGLPPHAARRRAARRPARGELGLGRAVSWSQRAQWQGTPYLSALLSIPASIGYQQERGC